MDLMILALSEVERQGINIPSLETDQDVMDHAGALADPWGVGQEAHQEGRTCAGLHRASAALNSSPGWAAPAGTPAAAVQTAEFQGAPAYSATVGTPSVINPRKQPPFQPLKGLSPV